MTGTSSTIENIDAVLADTEWMTGPDAATMHRLNLMDRICFHRELTVKELRMICAIYGVDVRSKASRDEVALIMRQHDLAFPTDTGFETRVVTVWPDYAIFEAKRMAQGESLAEAELAWLRRHEDGQS